MESSKEAPEAPKNGPTFIRDSTALASTVAPLNHPILTSDRPQKKSKPDEIGGLASTKFTSYLSNVTPSGIPIDQKLMEPATSFPWSASPDKPMFNSYSPMQKPQFSNPALAYSQKPGPQPPFIPSFTASSVPIPELGFDRFLKNTQKTPQFAPMEPGPNPPSMANPRLPPNPQNPNRFFPFFPNPKPSLPTFQSFQQQQQGSDHDEQDEESEGDDEPPHSSIPLKSGPNLNPAFSPFSSSEMQQGGPSQGMIYSNSIPSSSISEKVASTVPPALLSAVKLQQIQSIQKLMAPNTKFAHGSGRFVLLEQPNVRQRKSYRNENRYILPNPLTICPKDDAAEKLPAITEGKVTVKLVNMDGQEFPSSKVMLECTDGSLIQNLDTNHSAHFSLKILETSDGNMLRFLFLVNYTSNGNNLEEKILSRPFQVFSNRKKHSKEKPSLLAMKPTESELNTETEIWIKGRGFSDKVTVTFGDKLARIIETTENLLTVMCPAKSTEGPVQVIVCNKYSHDQMSSDKTLTFTYKK